MRRQKRGAVPGSRDSSYGRGTMKMKPCLPPLALSLSVLAVLAAGSPQIKTIQIILPADGGIRGHRGSVQLRRSFRQGMERHGYRNGDVEARREHKMARTAARVCAVRNRLGQSILAPGIFASPEYRRPLSRVALYPDHSEAIASQHPASEVPLSLSLLHGPCCPL